MPSNSILNSYDVHATLARRVFPLAMTMLLWSALINGAHLALSAL